MRKSREKILRIRPYNMANFSGGSYYMPFYAMFEAMAFFPISFVVVFLYGATAKETGEGKLDYIVLKQRLLRSLLLMTLLLCVFYIYILCQGFWELSDFWEYAIVTIWLAAVFSLGIFCALYFSAKKLNDKGKLTLGKWILHSLLYGVLIIIGGILVSLFFGSLGLDA